MSVITENSKVKLHYTGKDSDGNIFDSTKAIEGTNFEDREPLEVQLGVKALIPGFEKGLQGMKIGETKTITIPSDEAYGPVIEDHFQEINKDMIPPDAQEGQTLYAQGPQGPIQAVVKEIKESTVVIDGNHPLAGKDLTFDLDIVSVD
jgi:FKBP-type peptidyl-prolyl cis-trans isomerase SlpA